MQQFQLLTLELSELELITIKEKNNFKKRKKGFSPISFF